MYKHIKMYKHENISRLQGELMPWNESSAKWYYYKFLMENLFLVTNSVLSDSELRKNVSQVKLR